MHSHKYINRKTPEILSFLVRLQASGFTVLRKRDYILDFFYEICDVLLNFIFTEDSWATASDFQQRFGHIIYSSSNKSTQSRLIVFLGPLQRAVRKQFTVFFAKIFKITKFERNILCGRGRRNEQKRIFSRSSHQMCFAKKSVLKYLVKLTGKHLCKSLFQPVGVKVHLKKDSCISIFL